MGGKKDLIKRAEPDEQTLDSLYEQFIMSRKVQNVRPATIDFYHWNLKAFRDYMGHKGIREICEINKQEIDSFILSLCNNYNNATTINTYLRATRTFVNFAVSQGYLEPLRVKLIKQERTVKDTYGEEDIKKLIKRPNLKQCSFTEYRNWVLIQYFLETGNRLNTVTNIRVGDVNLASGMVILRTTKNRKAMFSPVGAALTKVITDYIKEWGLNEEDYLFPNSERGQLTKNAIQNSIARYNRSRGVQLTSIHCFRHTFAKRYVTKGGNAFKLQRLLGHSSLTVTENYISLFATDLATDFHQF